MAGIEITVLDHVTPMLRSAITRLTNMRPPLSLAGHYMFKETIRQFETRGLRGGTPWKPLAPLTILLRRNHSDAPLQDTGRLRRSVTSVSAPGSVWELSDTTLRLGTNLEYAAIHQYGGVTETGGSAILFKTKKRGWGRAGDKATLRATSGKRMRDFRYIKWKAGAHIPARPFLVVTDANRAEIGQIFLRYATGAFRK